MIKSSIARLMNIRAPQRGLHTGLLAPVAKTIIVAMIAAISGGCSLSDGGMTSYIPKDKFLASLKFEHRSINLSTDAPFDTVTLKTIRLMGDGSEAPDEVEYSVSSPRISITDGVLRADTAIAEAMVFAKLTYGSVVRIDTAIVSVVDGAPTMLSEFGIDLNVGDSAKRAAMESAKNIQLIRNSATGANLPNIFVSISSTDSTIASIVQSSDNLLINPLRPGRVVFYASTYAYGTTFKDSLVFTVGWPLSFGFPVYEKFMPGSTAKIMEFGYGRATLGVGACVRWLTQSRELNVDVVFDDPSQVAAPVGTPCMAGVYDPTIGGNIEPFHILPYPTLPPDRDPTPEEIDEFMKAVFSSRRARAFRTPGVFPFRNTIHGTSGVISICDESNDTTCAPAGIGPWH